MLQPDVTIVKTTETRKYALDGTSKAYLRVEFMVGKHGPFVENIEKDGFTALGRDERLNAFAEQVRA